MSLTPRFTLAGRKLRIAFLLPAFLLLAGCHRTLNPWMSPVVVDVHGECAHFTGRIIANWAGRRWRPNRVCATDCRVR